MARFQKVLIVLLLLFLFVSPGIQESRAQEPVVRAVLFYSSSCPHCLEVINEFLPSLVNKYGTQLQIYGANTSEPDSNRLFQQAADAYGIPKNELGVPTLVVGDQWLVGSQQIPEEFPGIVEEGLASGGIDWPEIPDLPEHMAAEQNPGNEGNSSQGQNLTIPERFRLDPAGNTLSVLVLFGMIGALVYAVTVWNDTLYARVMNHFSWLIPVLSVIGIAVASYLAFVEVTQTEAVCGPIGNCNTVQQSEYATLFGLIHVGVLGVLGYLGILASWLLKKVGPETWRPFLTTAIWGMTLFGTVFSIYLTFLEPFVIGATCMWCVTSAVIMTALFLVATGSASASLGTLLGKRVSEDVN